MTNNGFDVERLRLNLDSELLGRLMDRMDCKNAGLTVRDLYLSDVALAVDIACESTALAAGRTQDTLGRLLRFISGRAEEVGLVLPLLCVIDAGGAPEPTKILETWAADQDWHRGDFSLIVLRNEEEGSEQEGDQQRARHLIHKLIGPAAAAWPQVELKPRGLEAIIESFESEQRSGRYSEEHAGLLRAMTQALREEAVGPVDKWLEDRLKDLSNLVAGSGNDGE
ncbi:MAG: hypothetical protein NUV99_09655 [Clostridia bacterium]|nr:hypothetical protein [Clostridia bacterium]